MENRKVLETGLRELNIDVTDKMMDSFLIYKEMLIQWNQRMNLTNITEEREVFIKHFLDSVSCVQCGIDLKDKKVIDVGTGAGFPGLPLKIALPHLKLTLLDSLNKRVNFLKEMAHKLNIECEVIHGRAEDYGRNKSHREKYDIVLSRAVANMAVLSEFTLPFVKQGGYLLCQKGPAIFDEIEQAKAAIETLGGELKEIVSTKVYGSDFSHYIAVVKKVKLCPGKYPRKAGMIEKNPIM
ncbi:ribosomal RNA small subunit methyltransferase G [Oxobacter pfennigii]|uniref:Ribosomal RNA small subunit methyltransferase G n=1 Tax=Oxobacter pfennigii TaxID=36849 RepID=A0A0P9ACY2_9CLOT|nr:16S rRNA (guanine(527)-N(7))-methyltransferase RsmG [Oxobacter pfennigii]KPU42949.1 ribosomal RNA small subunit methyltransferase G [Oxobacter pfennigii]